MGLSAVWFRCLQKLAGAKEPETSSVADLFTRISQKGTCQIVDSESQLHDAKNLLQWET